MRARHVVATLAVVSLALAVVPFVAGCGGNPSAQGKPGLSATPQPAPSVAATSLPAPVASSPFDARIVSVFLKDRVTSKQRAQLAGQIARIPGVQAFAFVSPKLALRRLREYLLKHRAIDEGSRPLPAFFEIVVKARGDALSVAKRFLTNPLVDNDPGTNDGVEFGELPANP